MMLCVIRDAVFVGTHKVRLPLNKRPLQYNNNSSPITTVLECIISDYNKTLILSECIKYIIILVSLSLHILSKIIITRKTLKREINHY